MEVNFTELLKKNPDTVGWIKVDGTKVNYPIVQAEDNDYYLSHAFNKRSNAGGWVFSVYTIEPEVYYLKTNFRTEPYDKFLNTLRGRSVYDFGIDVTTDDKILTLSTCDNTGTKRVAVHAKMINIEYK